MRATHATRALAVLLLAATLGGCAARNAYKRGNAEANRGNWDAAVVHYTRAAREDPDNIAYRMALQRALVEAAAQHVAEARKRLAAEDLEGALDELRLAVQLDPSNRYAQEELAETRRKIQEREERRREATEFERRRERVRRLLATEPVLEPASEAPINLKFAEDTSLRKIFEVLSQLSGINILFDESFRDKRVTVDLVDVSFREALEKLTMINRLFYKVVDPATIIIIPDNPQKHRQYDDLVLKTFYVVNAEVNTVANMLRTIAGIQRVQPNPELKAITVRATPDQVAVAERIVSLNDKSKSEIVLDIEILEVNRSKLLEFGLRASEYEAGLTYQPAGSTVDQGRTTQRLNRLAAGDLSDFLITFPSSAIYRFFKTNSEARILAQPKLRATEGQAAELRLGQEVPIPVTSFVSQFGQPGALPTTPVTSFQFRNVGINISITPKVFVDGEIELQLVLESSTQVETRTIAGIELPVFGTRNVTSVVRLRDGETNLIGGLISSEDRQAVSGLPGISDVPILNKIFSSSRQDFSETEVVFSITPHIVRAPRVTDEDLLPLPMGTEQRIRVPSAEPPPFGPPPEEPVPPPPAPPAPGPEEPEAARPPVAEPEEEAPPEPVEAEPEEPAAPEPGLEEPVPEEPEAPLPPGPEEPGPPPEEPEAPGALAPEPGEEPPPAPAPISVLLSPPSVTAAVGERFDLVLIAGGAQALSSGEINVTFDPAALDVVDVQPGPFLTIDGARLTFVPLIEAGRVRIQFSRPGDTVGLRGSGHVARITFEVLQSAPPRIVSATGMLRDPQGAPIPASFASARVEIR